MLDRLGALIECLFERHKAVRRLTVFWACALITWVTLRIFADPAVITAAVATAYATVTGLLTVAIGLYQWSRQQEDRRDD